MAKRIKMPAIKPETRVEWLKRSELGETPPQIAEADSVDVRTVRKHVELARMERDTEFKVEITNSIECYTYIFGKETDGSSYVLFPYTKKHSPYCGITGTRLFPKDYSLYPDEQGERDFIAIVVSRQKLDYNLLNDAINAAPGSTYDQKVYEAMEDELVRDIDFRSGNTIRFSTGQSGRNAVAMVMEILK